jgi:membrane protease YdiL (CAAX protease family)
MPWDVMLIFLVLGVVVPWRGRAKLQQLLAKPRVESAERLSLYASTIAFQWVAVAAAAWRAWAHGYTAAQLGLALPGRLKISIVAILGAGIVIVLQWLNLRRMGRSHSALRQPVQALASRILPQSRKELIAFTALAITAGLCEEFLYRGFAMAVLAQMRLPTAVVVACSAILFGLAHLYQGKAGFLGTTLLGILFGSARAAFGSLAPVMAWHIGVDLVAGIAGPRYLTDSKILTADGSAQ